MTVVSVIDEVMAFLLKRVGAFFVWWKKITRLENRVYAGLEVDWSMMAFIGLLIVAMVVFLPWH